MGRLDTMDGVECDDWCYRAGHLRRAYAPQLPTLISAVADEHRSQAVRLFDLDAVEGISGPESPEVNACEAQLRSSRSFWLRHFMRFRSTIREKPLEET